MTEKPTKQNRANHFMLEHRLKPKEEIIKLLSEARIVRDLDQAGRYYDAAEVFLNEFKRLEK